MRIVTAIVVLSGLVSTPVWADRDQALALKQLWQGARTSVQAHRTTHEPGVSLVLGAAEALLWAAPAVVQVDLHAELARAMDRHLAENRH